MSERSELAQSNAAHLGGAALALGCFAYATAVVVYLIFYGQPDGTGPGGDVTLADRAAHLQGRWQLAQALWLVEMLAAVLIAVAAFVLQHRRNSSPTRLAPGLAWATVGVGALLLSLMYPFMLGGYPIALRALSEEPGLFALINGIATFIFNIGNAVLFAGLAAAFATESTRPTVIPRGIGIAGTAICLLSSIVAFGMFIGVVGMAAAGTLGLTAFGLAGFLGLAIWRRGESTEAKPVRN